MHVRQCRQIRDDLLICGMFFILSKTVGLLLNPLILLLALLLPGVLLKKPLLKRVFLGLFTFFFLLFSNPFLTNEVMLWWEVPPIPYRKLPTTFDAAIVLSGVTASDKGPYDRVHLHKGGDRIMHAVQLYKLGLAKNILITGGSGILEADSISESERMRRVMLLSGIPTDHIILEEASRNTFENAQFTKQLLDKRFPQGQFLLVTSAFHMRRSQACFQKAGVEALSFSTDFYSMDTPYRVEHFLIPYAEAIATWSKLLKEWFGLLTYKLMGYI
jgi:uncharacterized SAM-binding protein YcdF (DUF218 family)